MNLVDDHERLAVENMVLLTNRVSLKMQLEIGFGST
jgi:hypothetical protein